VTHLRVASLLALIALGLAAAAPARAQVPPPAGGPQSDVASYQLDVRLDVAAKQIRGSGRIRYRNASADTLREIWLRLYLNAFRSRDTAWMKEGGGLRGAGYDPAAPGWIRVEELRVAGGGAALDLPDGGDTEATSVRVSLPAPLPPGETLEMDVHWTTQLPRVFARTGYAGEFFMAGQWYPKLAVYDRGRWDTEPWHANAEFFADFGDYDLALTLPERFRTGASGVRRDETANGDGTKTVRYRAERVTDIAWTAWPDFRVFSREVAAAGARVQVELFLPPGEAGFAERHFAAIGAALVGYGAWYGAYPWPKLTVVVPPPGAGGAGGMEYPTLVTTGAHTPLPAGLDAGVRDVEVVTVHEIAHEWFPMQVQTNEAAEAWLDEGFADYLSIRVLGRWFGEDRSLVDLPFGRMGYADQGRALLALAATEPLATPSWQFADTFRYAATVYGKGSLSLLSLERTYSDARFTAALRAYADRWRWRHPTSADLQAALEESLGEKLDWFFDGLVYGREVVDYRATSLTPDRAVVERRGGVRFPVEVRLTFADGTAETRPWDGSGAGYPPGWELDGGGRPLSAVVVDPDRKLAVELDRLNNERRERTDLSAPLALSARGLALVQAMLQLLGAVG
jgi:hypothetical protein